MTTDKSLIKCSWHKADRGMAGRTVTLSWKFPQNILPPHPSLKTLCIS